MIFCNGFHQRAWLASINTMWCFLGFQGNKLSCIDGEGRSVDEGRHYKTNELQITYRKDSINPCWPQILKIRVQLTREVQTSRDIRYYNGNEVVEITMCREWQASWWGSGYHKVPCCSLFCVHKDEKRGLTACQDGSMRSYKGCSGLLCLSRPPTSAKHKCASMMSSCW